MRRKWVSALALGAVLVVSSCGEDETSGNAIDRAFIAGMVPHHQLAIEMAELAQERGQSDFVRSLADDIVAAQTSEIALMRRIDSELDNHGVKVGDLGVPEHLMGMGGQMAKLESAHPFDRGFIAMMVPHHAGAIRMARIELGEGENDTLKSLAERIIAAQSREIQAMNAHRADVFGAPSPAGASPPKGDGAPGHEQEMHDSH